MALGKLYIGKKVREIRDGAGDTQAAFAERLGISTSYLNQIENNQRPVSATIILALAERFNIEISEFSRGESDRLMSAAREALADPLFEGLTIGLQDLKLIAQNAPQLAHALINCHQAYRRASEQLASMDDTLGRHSTAADPSPYEEVRDFFHFLDNYVDRLDRAAELLAVRLDIPANDLATVLTRHLFDQYRVRVKLSALSDGSIRHFDPESKTLHLNLYAPSATRCFQIAYQVGALEMADTIEAIVAEAEFRTKDAADIARIGLRNYFAGALVLPYGPLLRAAAEMRHDLELLANRFGTSIEQVAHRLSTLQRPGQKGIPVFFARIDRAGNITKRHSAAKLQFARYGAACPLWNAHRAFEMPGRFLRQLAEMPDGSRYLSVATEISKGGSGFNAERPRFAIAFGCDIADADKFVYADGLNLASRAAFEPIGISCRICERKTCAQRAVPPIKSALEIDHNHRGILPYKVT
jgi:predicted transcriptional regulator/DNA-binding XRE family transcriptional regulator